MKQNRILLIDLNNFALYPSIAIGYLTSVLRASGCEVQMFAPLSVGIQGVTRSKETEPWWGRLGYEFRYRTGISKNKLVKRARLAYTDHTASQINRNLPQIVGEIERALDGPSKPDAVLVSTYQMYFKHCQKIGEICASRGIPYILGGPYFNAREVASEWFDIEGLSALIGGEVESHLAELIQAVIDGEDLSKFDGVWTPCADRGIAITAPPLVDLDSLPFPDYSDFPWEKYPNRIVPIITGRGCGWGVCDFCSDVTSTSGRNYRSRSPENVLSEVKHQNSKCSSKHFVFTDLKLNSNLDVWRALGTDIQNAAPGSKWIGSVHVGVHGDNGLSYQELATARQNGLVRLTTGFETASQRLLDKMAKGTSVGETARFIEDASKVGISVRLTMFTGYPFEEASDLDQTTEFLKQLSPHIERVSLNRFQLMSGTRASRDVLKKPQKYPLIENVVPDHRNALIGHHFVNTETRPYRKAISKLLEVVHQINRKPLRESARDFVGVM